MKILIIGPSWIGDMMMSHSLYRLLKNQYFNIKIDVLAQQWCHKILYLMPEVNKVIILPLNHGEISLRKRYIIGKNLKKVGYDIAYILPNSFKSALIPFFAEIKQRIGWRGEMRYGLINDLRKLNTKKLPLMVDRYLALADRNFISGVKNDKLFFPPKIAINHFTQNKIKQKFNIVNHNLMIGFCYGAENNLSKCWPHYHYASLAKLLISDGYQIIFLGSNKDLIQSKKIFSLFNDIEKKHCINLSGKTDLIEVSTLISNCNAIVSNDSGLMHIAAALNVPLIALYGPTSPSFTPPITKKAIVIQSDLQNKNIFSKIQYKNYDYRLININPYYVYETIKILLKKYYNESINY